VKYSTITKKTDPDAGTFPLGDLSSKLFEKSKNVRPLNVSRDRMSKDGFQCFEIFPFHMILVPQNSTTVKSPKIFIEKYPGRYTGLTAGDLPSRCSRIEETTCR